MNIGSNHFYKVLALIPRIKFAQPLFCRFDSNIIYGAACPQIFWDFQQSKAYLQSLVEHSTQAYWKAHFYDMPFASGNNAVEECNKIKQYFIQNPEHLILSDDFGRTWLHLAVIFGCLGTVQYLLELGFDPDLQDQQGRTALHYALHGQRKDVEALLIEYQAKSIKDIYGLTPLDHVRIQQGIFEEVPMDYHQLSKYLYENMRIPNDFWLRLYDLEANANNEQGSCEYETALSNALFSHWVEKTFPLSHSNNAHLKTRIESLKKSAQLQLLFSLDNFLPNDIKERLLLDQITNMEEGFLEVPIFTATHCMYYSFYRKNSDLFAFIGDCSFPEEKGKADIHIKVTANRLSDIVKLCLYEDLDLENEDDRDKIRELNKKKVNQIIQAFLECGERIPSQTFKHRIRANNCPVRNRKVGWEIFFPDIHKQFKAYRDYLRKLIYPSS